MTHFDTFIMVDWSGGNDRGPKPKADAIWACMARRGNADTPVYLRNRHVAEAWLKDTLSAELSAGRRVCTGFDFPFGYPFGFAAALVGVTSPLNLWDWLEARIEDNPASNSRFDLAADINRCFQGVGPFWGNGLKRDIADLPRMGTARVGHGMPEKRRVEKRAKGAFPVWQLSGAGSVGGQTLTGLPVLARLRRHFAGKIGVWPFEPLNRPLAFVEIWPSLFVGPAPEGVIKDAHQVSIAAAVFSAMTPEAFAQLLPVDDPDEGWILGVGQENALRLAAIDLADASLRNDCFALPPGVDWTPVDDALAHLRDALVAVTSTEMIPVPDACTRILATDQIARRANPPAANSAVDGYGFAHASLPAGASELPLHPGRAAAGAAFDGTLPAGHALRILTGAILPDGVDTVVLEEDVRVDDQTLFMPGTVKPGSNTRRAGEDIHAGDIAHSAGRRLTPADLALLSAVGIADVPVRTRLRVGVLSTGDELVAPGATDDPARTYDANRPMLLAILARLGHLPVDLGHVGDNRDALRTRLDQAAKTTDAILTSGGASAGEEDHVSALLEEAGTLNLWRIAVKPGRPLALGQWHGKPVFGLPGNPVAALVCTLIFARPALDRLAGADWSEPQGFVVPAAFEKRKKPGRREYLRARITAAGAAEVFASEGSGRISGLSWADGLVELDDGARHVRPGDPVRYIPFASFGI